MNKTTPQKLGRLGEQKAIEYLKYQGYNVLTKNYRWARGEIDLIATDKNTLVFFEIKTSSLKNRFGSPETWVNSRKQQQIGNTALKYLQEHDLENMDCRFDVIGVIYDGCGNWYFRHIQDAFWL